MSDSAARPPQGEGQPPREDWQPHAIEHDFDVIDSALEALDSDDLEAAEALAEGLRPAAAEPDGPAGQSAQTAESADGGAWERPSADRPD